MRPYIFTFLVIGLILLFGWFSPHPLLSLLIGGMGGNMLARSAKKPQFWK